MVTALTLLLAGCSQPPLQVERFFRLEARSPARLSTPLLDGTLVVKRFSAEALLSQRAIVYADAAAPQPLYQYSYQLWADAPTVMLQQLTASALREAGVAKHVVTPAEGASAEYSLSGRIVHLEQLVGAAPAVVVELELAAFDDVRYELLLLRSYRLDLAVGEPGVEAAVAVMNQALTRILAQFVSDLTGSSRGAS